MWKIEILFCGVCHTDIHYKKMILAPHYTKIWLHYRNLEVALSQISFKFLNLKLIVIL